jgi:hypothetical protein
MLAEGVFSGFGIGLVDHAARLFLPALALQLRLCFLTFYFLLCLLTVQCRLFINSGAN